MGAKDFRATTKAALGHLVTQELINSNNQGDLESVIIQKVEKPQKEVKPAEVKRGRPCIDPSEKRSRHYNGYFRPSTMEALQCLASLERRPVSAILDELAENYIKSKQDILDKWGGFAEANIKK